MKPELIGAIAALASAASWAGGAILFKRAGETLSPLAMTLVKALLSVILFAIPLAYYGFERMTPQVLSMLVVSGILGIAVADSLFFAALQYLGARDIVLLLCLGQVFTVFLAVLLPRERPELWQWVGIALVIAGVTAALYSPDTGAATHRTRGLILGLLSAAFMSYSLIVAKPALESVSGLQGAMIRMASGGLGILILGLGRGQVRNWVVSFGDLKSLKFFLAGTLVVAYGGFWLSLVAIKNGEVSINSTLISTEPMFALPLAAIFLKERVTRRALIGTVLAFVGVVLCTRGIL